MDKLCNKAEGAQLLETMRKICDATGCKDIEHATLAYEETLQEKTNRWIGETRDDATVAEAMLPQKS